MEILEVLFALIQGCGCVLEAAAAAANAFAAVQTARYAQSRREGSATERKIRLLRWAWALGIFLLFAVILRWAAVAIR